MALNPVNMAAENKVPVNGETAGTQGQPVSEKNNGFTEEPKVDSSTPVKKMSDRELNNEMLDDALNDKYVEKRSITISLVHNYSNYRKVNMKILGQRKEVIGSSIRSCRVLSSNKEAVEKYFPAIIGLSPNNPEFVTRVKSYLSNISMAVAENNVVLNTSFIYDHKKDYLKIRKEEEAINAAYDKIDRSNISELKEALNLRIEALNTLESTKCKYGTPENIEEYLMYRHCLLYSEVAKDIALINADPSIRFYIKDELKEAEKTRRLIDERKTAMRNFVELDAKDAKFNAVFVAVCVIKGDNLAEALLKDRSARSVILMDYANTYPDRFNKLVTDKHIATKALIETLITRGELIRSEYNQQISTAEGVFVGSNLKEAVAYFDNPNNAELRTAYENKLKLF